MRLAGTKDGGWFTLNESWKSKMEIPAGSKKEIPANLDAGEIRFLAGG